MYVSSLRGSAGELLDGSLVLARRHYHTILRAALPALVLSALVEVLLTLLGLSSSSSLIGMLVVLIPWSLAEGLAIASCWFLLHRESATFVDSWDAVAPRAAAVVITYSIKWILIIPAVFLLVLPGLFFIALFFALPTVCITEKASFSLAFKRTRALSRGRFKRIAATLGFLEIVGIAIAMIVPLILPGGTFDLPSVWDTLGGWVVGIVLLPLRAALMTLLYLDLRATKEGYDLGVALNDLARAV
jgi:hypothetical protein